MFATPEGIDISSRQYTVASPTENQPQARSWYCPFGQGSGVSICRLPWSIVHRLDLRPLDTPLRQRHRHHHLRALAWDAFDPALASHALGALAHRAHAQVPRRHAACVEARPVVLYPQHYALTL